MDDTSIIEAGYPIEGAGIPAGATVLSITNGTTFELSANATATASNITATFLPYGGGDGLSTFNVPDARGEGLRGWDDGRGVDSGRALGEWQDFMQETVTGTVLSTYSTCPRTTPTGVFTGSVPIGYATVSCPTFSTTQSMGRLVFDSSNSGAKTGAETRMRNINFLVCIKY